MKCRACNATIARTARFCAQCGVTVAESAPSARPDLPHVSDGAADDDIRAARAFAADARARHAQPGTLGASMARGAAIGAVVALPVPLIGPLAGAMVGAGVAAFQKLTKD